MKKVLLVLAMAGVFVACGDKKKSDKPAGGEDTAAKTTTTPPANNTEPTATTSSSTPKFSDPEVQKFADDYAAFMTEYKNGMSDPAKAADMAAKMQEWSKKSTEIGMKLATKPEEAKAWADWVMQLSKEMMPTSK